MLGRGWHSADNLLSQATGGRGPSHWAREDRTLSQIHRCLQVKMVTMWAETSTHDLTRENHSRLHSMG